jgi:hypothetical protein
MRGDRLTLVLFALYCFEVGLFLTLAPWTLLWSRNLAHLPSLELQSLLLHPFTRSVVTGFGLVHLIWGLHDLRLALGGGREERDEP